MTPAAPITEEQIDADVSRSIGWWVTNRKDLAKHIGGPDCTRVKLEVSQNAIVCFGGCGQIIKVLPIIRDNEPCICGSGRKWKKCCQQEHENE